MTAALESEEEPSRPEGFSTLRTLAQFWRNFVILGVPIVALPLIFIGEEGKTDQAFKCAYVLVVMAVFWVTEALPLAITSLLPVVMLPALGIMTTDAVGKEYLKETNMMFLSGIMVAIAVEHCNLHKRIALTAMLLIGTSPRKLMLGFMLPTMFLSMWISNTATTAMMVPIVDAVLDELEIEAEKGGGNNLNLDQSGKKRQGEEEGEGKEAKKRPVSARDHKIRVMLFLSLAYAANTGGTGTLTGTGPNLVLKGVLSEFAHESNPINFANWMLYASPAMLLNIVALWIWLQYWFMGFSWTMFGCQSKHSRVRVRDSESAESGVEPESESRLIRRVLKRKKRELGPMSFHEGAILGLFILLVLLWFFRDPKFIKGWGNFVKVTEYGYEKSEPDCQSDCSYTRVARERDAIDDASAGMFVVVCLFILPRTLQFWPFNRDHPSSPSESLHRWSAIHSRMPWGLVLLLGGGFALAKAVNLSGLSVWMGGQLSVLDGLPRWLLVLVVCAFTAAATEVTSNVATASILMPVMKDLSVSLRINPLYLMVPATLSCSYAFMLPVATPPNAIVYSASGMKSSEMFYCGFFVNLFCIALNFVCLNTYGIPLFDLNHIPDWANSTRAAF